MSTTSQPITIDALTAQAEAAASALELSRQALTAVLAAQAPVVNLNALQTAMEQVTEGVAAISALIDQAPNAPVSPPPTTTPAPSTTPPPVAISAPGIPFSASSPFLTPIPADVELDPNSAAIVANLNAQIKNNFGHPALNFHQYSSTVYVVPDDQPLVDMVYNPMYHPAASTMFAPHLLGVPIPDGAVAGPGDLNVIFYQPGTDTLWEFGKFEKNSNGQYMAAYGGRINNVSKSIGQFPIQPGVDALGVSASGLSLYAGQISLAELQAGEINHALGMGVPTPSNQVSWPANRTDGTSADATCPTEGQRWRLDPTIDVASLGISPAQTMIAKALQKYGIICMDTSGVVCLYAECDPAGVNEVVNGLFPGNDVDLTGIPWDKMQVLPMNYGQPST